MSTALSTRIDALLARRGKTPLIISHRDRDFGIVDRVVRLE